MNTRTFDTMTRGAAAVSRRGSLRLLGGAALGSALATPALAAAGKTGKKGQKRCRRQRGQCLAFVEEFCQPKGDPGACEEQLSPCCEHLARCSAGEGIECLFSEVFESAG